MARDEGTQEGVECVVAVAEEKWMRDAKTDETLVRWDGTCSGKVGARARARA